jgi:glutamate carboxypeptidase
MPTILEYLKQHTEDMEETLIRLVKAESPSRNKRLSDRCGQVLAGLFDELVGGGVEMIEQETVGNQYRFTVGSGTEQILIIGHYDTVWDEGDIPLREENGLLYGPGVFDMKGGLTVTLWALNALKQSGMPFNKKVVFLTTSDEEIGSFHSRALIEEEAKKSGLVLVPESSISNSGAVKTFRKGIGIFGLEVSGKAVHAGINPWEGVSAIDELVLQLQDLKGLDDREAGVSVNIGTISGGTRTNVVADYAEAMIDVRFRTQAQGEALEAAFRSRPAFIPGAEIHVKGGINRYPMEETDAVLGLYSELKAIAAEHGYELGKGGSGGASDGNFTAALGIPTIDGLGPVGDGAHAVHEQVLLENLPYRAALIAQLIARHLE